MDRHRRRGRENTTTKAEDPLSIYVCALADAAAHTLFTEFLSSAEIETRATQCDCGKGIKRGNKTEIEREGRQDSLTEQPWSALRGACLPTYPHVRMCYTCVGVQRVMCIINDTPLSIPVTLRF